MASDMGTIWYSQGSSPSPTRNLTATAASPPRPRGRPGVPQPVAIFDAEGYSLSVETPLGFRLNGSRISRAVVVECRGRRSCRSRSPSMAASMACLHAGTPIYDGCGSSRWKCRSSITFSNSGIQGTFWRVLVMLALMSSTVSPFSNTTQRGATSPGLRAARGLLLGRIAIW
jgi:hypothetical protein